MSKRRCRVRASTSSSSSVRRSRRSVATPCAPELAGDELVARAVSAASASVGEQDEASRARGNRQPALEPRVAHRDTYVAVDRSPDALRPTARLRFGACSLGARTIEQLDDVVIGGRREVVVPETDGEEGLLGVEADDLVGERRQVVERFCGRRRGPRARAGRLRARARSAARRAPCRRWRCRRRRR